jgi:hypothetical protein
MGHPYQNPASRGRKQRDQYRSRQRDLDIVCFLARDLKYRIHDRVSAVSATLSMHFMTTNGSQDIDKSSLAQSMILHITPQLRCP